jgi:apolipoprotein N-acyltransferase
VHFLAVPTNDWRQVKDIHFENAIFRALENRTALVRGASNGISAIVSGRGKILTRKDHFRSGPGIIVADVPVFEGGTFYSRVGDWPALVSFVLLLLGVLRSWRRPETGHSFGHPKFSLVPPS